MNHPTRQPTGRIRFGVPMVLALGLAALWNCDSPSGPGEKIQRPPETGDGWQTASLEEVGMAPPSLLRLLDLIEDTDGHMIHSILIVRNGKLVFEEYWPGTDLALGSLETVDRVFDRNTLHYVASVSKSITSLLAGIALDQGLIQSVNESVFDHYPDYQAYETVDSAPITLRHLLSFSSGFDWNEFVYGFDDSRDSHNEMFRAEDPIAYLLGRSVVTPPGAVFHYNSGDTNLLGEIIRRASSSPSLVDYAAANLFEPLGIESYQWTRFGSAPQLTFASGGVSLRPRDMAKLGVLCLDGGAWNGQQVVSQEWIDESTQMAVPLPGSYTYLYGYGYNWWLGRLPYRSKQVDFYRAAGWGGQDVFVFPELSLVVAFTAGGYYEARALSVEGLLEDYVLPAVHEPSG